MESNTYLTPEKNLILKIIEQWGNAATMGEMEQWLKDYAKLKIPNLVKSLKLIAQMSDPGDHWVAVTRMKSIASDALSLNDESAGESDAVEFAEWITERYAPTFNEGIISTWLEYTDKGKAEYATHELYAIFKQQKEK